MKKWYGLPAAALVFFVIGCNGSDSSGDDNPPPVPHTPAINYSITGTVPHDTTFFTEGLEFYNNTLLESTGLKKESRLVSSDLKSGKALRQLKLDDQYFGEGLTVLHDTLYQLTWQEHVVLVYTAKDFRKVKEFPLMGDGWGLTNDGKNLIASNGTSDIYFYDPATFKVVRSISVMENGSLVSKINELEYVNGFIYANQWETDYILKINAETGEVVAKMDFSQQAQQERDRNPKAEVLNGIAYNKENKKFYVTGKNWSQLFELQFAH